MWLLASFRHLRSIRWWLERPRLAPACAALLNAGLEATASPRLGRSRVKLGEHRPAMDRSAASFAEFSPSPFEVVGRSDPEVVLVDSGIILAESCRMRPELDREHNRLVDFGANLAGYGVEGLWRGAWRGLERDCRAAGEAFEGPGGDSAGEFEGSAKGEGAGGTLEGSLEGSEEGGSRGKTLQGSLEGLGEG